VSKLPDAFVRAACAALFVSLAGRMTAAQVPATQPDSDLRQEVRELRAEMEQMKAHDQELEKELQDRSAGPATAPADSQAAAAQRVIQEADGQSFVMSSIGLGAGWDASRGAYIASDDGNFLLHPFVLLQMRDVTNQRDDAKGPGESETENGFETRRLQLGLDGNAFSPDFTYRVFVQADRSGGETTLYDAWVKYHLPNTAWSIEGGQFKAPLAHEQMVFDRTLLAADRTLLDDVLARGEAFSQGAMAVYDNQNAVRVKADFTNGYGINDMNFASYPARPANFGIGARAEYKFMGQWRDYDQFTAYDDKDDLLVADIGGDWTEADPSDAIRQAADVQWDHQGLGLYAAYIGDYTSRNGTNGSEGNTYDGGAAAQISYLIGGTNLEPFGRYDYLHFDDKEFAARTQTTVHEFTVGVNYYFKGQNAKLTVDGMYLPNGSPVDDNGSGVLVSNGHEELVARVQFQLAL